ncbi:MAG: hypothetical protein WD894_24275 [Pirellulales bacterium]
MAKNVDKLARMMGARIVGKVPDVGGGAFGAARLAKVLHTRLQPQIGIRPGRPSDPDWTLSRKVPMSPTTLEQLKDLANQVSDENRKVSPMQVAAQLLEAALSARR